jgi:hypothetical protein
MTDDVPERAARAFERHEAFEGREDGYAVTTTRFDTTVTAAETDDWALRYEVTVRLPMLSTVVEGDVGPAVEEGWFETLERRLGDATMATRRDVDLVSHDVAEQDGDAVATFVFEERNADRAPDVVKAIGEYAEGTYVEGVVPGYEYGDPVAAMLGEARQGEEGDRGPMPL